MFPQSARQVAKQLVRSHFKNDYGEPFELTDGQADIFLLIFTRAFNRNQIVCATQYGKSDTVAIALVLRSSAFNEPWAIISGSQDKAQIIMSRVIQHTFDHPRFYKKLELDANNTLDRLRRERSKDHITWLGGGGIKTFTANTSNRQATKEALTGFGSPNIIEDEASLVPDDVQAMVLRMLGGHRDNFLLKIGNPFYRNHFYKTSRSEKYQNVLIDYKQAIAEGRYTQEFIDEMSEEPFFDILYECRFPDEDEILEGGYRRLVVSALLDNAEVDEIPAIVEGDQPVLGVDVARGGKNQTIYVLRYLKSNFARVLEKNNDPDLSNQMDRIKKYKRDYNIPDFWIGIDDSGVGGGLTDMCRREDIMVTPVQGGASAKDNKRYANMKAELFWKGSVWLKRGGKLVKDIGFRELEQIHYKENVSSKLQMEPKQDLLKRGIMSPDTADAWANTFIPVESLVDVSDIDVI